MPARGLSRRSGAAWQAGKPISICTHPIITIERDPIACSYPRMPRIPGIEPSQAGLFARFVYWMTRRRFGHVLEGVKIAAHTPRLLRGLGQMEMTQAALKSVDPKLVALAEIKAAAMIGCPF
jgi:hypothetical protein